MTRAGSRRSAPLVIVLVLMTAACHGGTGTSTGSIAPATTSLSATGQVSAVRLGLGETIHVDGPQDLAITGGSIWTVSESLDALDRIDVKTGQVTSIPLGAGFSPQQLEAVDGAVWVTGAGGATGAGGGIARIDPKTEKITARIPGSFQWLASGSGSLWASGPSGGVQVDPRTSTVVRKIGQPDCVVSVGGGSAWVSCGHKLERIDPATGQVIATIDLPRGTLAADGRVFAAGDSLWLMSSRNIYQVKHFKGASSTLDRIDPSTNELVPGSTIDLVKGACSPLPVPVGDHIWFPISIGVGPDVGMLFDFDATTGRVVKTYDLSEGKGYGNAIVAFGYGSMWTESYQANQVRRWQLPTN